MFGDFPNVLCLVALGGTAGGNIVSVATQLSYFGCMMLSQSALCRTNMHTCPCICAGCSALRCISRRFRLPVVWTRFFALSRARLTLGRVFRCGVTGDCAAEANTHTCWDHQTQPMPLSLKKTCWDYQTKPRPRPLSLKRHVGITEPSQGHFR